MPATTCPRCKNTGFSSARFYTDGRFCTCEVADQKRATWLAERSLTTEEHNAMVAAKAEAIRDAKRAARQARRAAR